jgi:hypothetical protein
MTQTATIWTEGKTDWQHLKRAAQVLGKDKIIAFRELEEDMGDDRLQKTCAALSLLPHASPEIFVFDRDNHEVVKKVEDPEMHFKNWGNNVFSLAIPVPDHRNNQPDICIEFNYSDEELLRTDRNGRRLFLSSEFDLKSGRHLVQPDLSIGNRRRLMSGNGSRL